MTLVPPPKTVNHGTEYQSQGTYSINIMRVYGGTTAARRYHDTVTPITLCMYRNSTSFTPQSVSLTSVVLRVLLRSTRPAT